MIFAPAALSAGENERRFHIMPAFATLLRGDYRSCALYEDQIIMICSRHTMSHWDDLSLYAHFKAGCRVEIFLKIDFLRFSHWQ